MSGSTRFAWVCLAGLLSCAVSGAERQDAPDLSMQASVGAGMFSYEEDGTIQSEWEAPGGVLEGRLRLCDPKGWILAGSGRITVTDEDREDWSEGGEVLQHNQMNFAGVHALGEAGHVIFRNSASEMAALAGAGFRYQHFLRDELVLNDDSYNDWQEAEEDVYLAYLNAALEASAHLADTLLLNGRVEAGYIFSAQVENSLVDDRTLDGKDGLILGAQLSLDWQATERSLLSCGLAWEQQEINGDTTEFYAVQGDNVFLYEVEWPDNALESLWANLSWTYTF